MGEIKSVKVDNWGVFFLQKLQNFFNKTDYCDLTLQFRDNSQLKVHRLVLSACTDYFNVLEQTCEVVDDAIIMPNGLQADVVVPIVNFMYTGTLEFELKMYNRLLRTAKDMNMTVLLKLLEAHRRTMEMHPQKASGQASPKPRRRPPAQALTTNVTANASGRSLIQTTLGNKRIVVGSSGNAPQNRNVPNNSALSRITGTGSLPLRQIGSTTFTRIKVENEQETSVPASAGGGYSLIKQSAQQQPQQPTSPFEQLRKGYNSNKRPAVSTFVSPPAKKPNLEDVKEFAEQQRMRKQIAAEFGDDDYDTSNIMDDDTIHNDDDDDEMLGSGGHTQMTQTLVKSATASVQTVTSSSNQQIQSEDPPGTTTIIVKHEGPDKPPTIVVKDSSNSKLNHAKIISEVLRQYPHLVKSNKSIKLKIMPNIGGQAQKIIVKKEPMETEKNVQAQAPKLQATAKTLDSHQQTVKTLASNIVVNRPKTMQQPQMEKPPSGKTASSGSQANLNKPAATSTSSTNSAPPASGPPQKRRIDSKTMHALIALGAENTTGPWLCLRCGRNGHPISIPSYRGFRRHLINTHKETIDPDLCEHCGWRSKTKRELHFHMQLLHKIKTNLYIFPECQLCQHMCIDSDGLNQHLIESHPDENKQQCIYCNKIFPEEIQLYAHMKTFHKKQALEDGIIDYSDDESQTQMTLPPLPSAEHDQGEQQEKKVKILSDISLPVASSIAKTDDSFVQQRESSIASATSEEYLQEQEHDNDNTETKFVAADGSEVILTAEQRKEILSQLNQEHEGAGVVMVLNENPQQQYGNAEIQSDQGAISHDENSQATTATNDDHEEEENNAAEEGDQHDDHIYNEMKSLHTNLDDSTSQPEASVECVNEENSLHGEERDTQKREDAEGGGENDERTEHLDESKESIDNLEWAENLISEHDLEDEVSSQAITESKPEKAQVESKDDDKSQDEISKKLKELTGEWSEDDDDILEEEPIAELSQAKDNMEKEELLEKDNDMKEAEEKESDREINAEKEAKEQEETRDFEDHAELLASLQSADKDIDDKHKEKLEADVTDSENIDEDDIDMALKSLHKEDTDEMYVSEKEGEKKDVKSPSEAPVDRAVDMQEQSAKNESGKQEEYISDEAETAVKVKEENCARELTTVDEPVTTASSSVKVDEATKKDLIESDLNQQEAMEENNATEVSAATETVKVKLEKVAPLEENAPEEKESNTSNLTNEEFLSVIPEINASTTDVTTVTNSAIISSSETVASSEATGETEAASTSNKEDMTLSSEDRVKSLISEWGDDDDEDEDVNDTDLKENL